MTPPPLLQAEQGRWPWRRRCRGWRRSPRQRVRQVDGWALPTKLIPSAGAQGLVAISDGCATAHGPAARRSWRCYASLRTRGTTVANGLARASGPAGHATTSRATPRLVARLGITPDASWRSRQFISLIRWTVSCSAIPGCTSSSFADLSLMTGWAARPGLLSVPGTETTTEPVRRPLRGTGQYPDRTAICRVTEAKMATWNWRHHHARQRYSSWLGSASATQRSPRRCSYRSAPSRAMFHRCSGSSACPTDALWLLMPPSKRRAPASG